MKKITFIIHEDKNFIEGYGYITLPEALWEPSIWVFIHSECNKLNLKYLKHFIRDEFIRNDELVPYSPSGYSEMIIPRGTRTFYLDIYVEDK